MSTDPGRPAGDGAARPDGPAQDALDALARLVEQARPVPLSSSAVRLPREELVAAVEALRSALPSALATARAAARERDEVLAAAAEEAAGLVAAGRAARDAAAVRTEVFQRAVQEADRLLEQARAQAEAMRVEVDDYVDGKLATFEVVLSRTLAAVGRGRDKLAGRSALDDRGDGDDAPLPY